MAVILGIVPASLVFFLRPARKGWKTARANNSVFTRISVLVLHKGSWVIARRKVNLEVEGLENVPSTGPVLIVARHFHHLYDGCVLMRAVPRRLHIFVALDWVRKRWLRSFMESACTLADWPVVLRAEQLRENTAQHSKTVSSAYSLNEAGATCDTQWKTPFGCCVTARYSLSFQRPTLRSTRTTLQRLKLVLFFHSGEVLPDW